MEQLKLAGGFGRVPPPAFYTLAMDMSLNRGAKHFTLVLSHPSYINITAPPLSKFTSYAPVHDLLSDDKEGNVA